MTSGKCRTCDTPAEAGPYCGPCADGIMANALRPYYRGRRNKNPPGRNQRRPDRGRPDGDAGQEPPRLL